MIRFLPPPTFLFGLFAGIAIFLFITGVTSYQSERCYQTHTSTKTKPSAQEEKARLFFDNERDKRDEEITDYAKRHPRVCGVYGFPRMAIAYMDDNEGFFVAAFTFALFIATFALWNSTEKLFRAGERQIKATEDAAQAAIKSANVAEKAVEGSESPFLYVLARRYDKTLREKAVRYATIIHDPDAFAEYNIVNYGKSPAMILEIYRGTIISLGYPDPVGFPPPQTNLQQFFVLGPGEKSRTSRIRGSAFLPKGWQNGAEAPPGSTKWLIIQVRYADTYRNQFVSGFCFAHNSNNKTFYGQGGPSLNYRRRLSREEQDLAEERDGSVPPHMA